MYIYVCVGVCIHIVNIQTEYIHESRLLGLGSTIYIHMYIYIYLFIFIFIIYIYTCICMCCAFVCVVSSLVLASA